MKEKVRKKILIPLIITFFFLLGASAVGIYWREAERIDDGTRRVITSVQTLFEDKLKGDAQLLRALVDFLEHEEAFQQAWLDRDRQALLDTAKPFFDEVRQKYKVTHFYFIDLERVCFLRVHNPKRHGDVIKRFTMLDAKRYPM